MGSAIRDHFPFGDLDAGVVERAAVLYPEIGDGSMAVVFDLARAAVRLLETAAGVLEAHDLTPARWRLIVALLFQSSDRTDTIGGLAAHLGVKEPTVTTTVTRMETEGLVRRIPDELDRRVSRVVLTDEGVTLATRLLPLLAARLREFVSAMGGPEIVAETASKIDRACDAVDRVAARES